MKSNWGQWRRPQPKGTILTQRKGRVKEKVATSRGGFPRTINKNRELKQSPAFLPADFLRLLFHLDLWVYGDNGVFLRKERFSQVLQLGSFCSTRGLGGQLQV